MKSSIADTKKWLVRAGTLLILLGFVLPTLAVSCSGSPDLRESFSLAQVATLPRGGMQILLLVPLGAMITLVLALLPSSPGLAGVLFFLGQVSGLGVGILSILISLLPYASQVQQPGLSYSPEFGVFFLIAGYGLCAAGLAFQTPELVSALSGGASPPVYVQELSYAPEAAYPSAPYVPEPPLPYNGQPSVAAPPPEMFQTARLSGTAYLRLVRGQLGQSFIPLSDGFTIGRSQGNHLQLQQPSISRQHARLRFAQGVWFIQDQNSRAGIFINGQRVPAARLQPGDQIQIGEYVFEFSMM